MMTAGRYGNQQAVDSAFEGYTSSTHTSAQKAQIIHRQKKMSADTNRRRKTLENKQRELEEKEERRRQAVLAHRKQSQLEATEKYQRGTLNGPFTGAFPGALGPGFQLSGGPPGSIGGSAKRWTDKKPRPFTASAASSSSAAATGSGFLAGRVAVASAGQTTVEDALRAIHAATSAESRSPGQVTHHTFSKAYLDHLDRQAGRGVGVTEVPLMPSATAHFRAQLLLQQQGADAQSRRALEELARASGTKAPGRDAEAPGRTTQRTTTTTTKGSVNDDDDHLSVDSLENDNHSEIGYSSLSQQLQQFHHHHPQHHHRLHHDGIGRISSAPVGRSSSKERESSSRSKPPQHPANQLRQLQQLQQIHHNQSHHQAWEPLERSSVVGSHAYSSSSLSRMVPPNVAPPGTTILNAPFIGDVTSLAPGSVPAPQSLGSPGGKVARLWKNTPQVSIGSDSASVTAPKPTPKSNLDHSSNRSSHHSNHHSNNVVTPESDGRGRHNSDSKLNGILRGILKKVSGDSDQTPIAVSGIKPMQKNGHYRHNSNNNNNNAKSNNRNNAAMADRNGELYIPQAIRKHMSDGDIRRLKDSIDVTRDQLAKQQQRQHQQQQKKSVRFVTPQAVMATGGDVAALYSPRDVDQQQHNPETETGSGSASTPALQQQQSRPGQESVGSLLNRPKRVSSAGGALYHPSSYQHQRAISQHRKGDLVIQNGGGRFYTQSRPEVGHIMLGHPTTPVYFVPGKHLNLKEGSGNGAENGAVGAGRVSTMLTGGSGAFSPLIVSSAAGKSKRLPGSEGTASGVFSTQKSSTNHRDDPMYAIKRVEAAQQDAKRTGGVGIGRGDGENETRPATSSGDATKRIERRLTNPDRTPTDEEIQWLWNKVRACLDDDSSGGGGGGYEPKIMAGTAAAASSAASFAQKMRSNESVMRALGGSAAGGSGSAGAAAHSTANHRGRGVTNNGGTNGESGNKLAVPSTTTKMTTTTNFATSQMVHLSKQGQAGLVSKLQQQQQQQQQQMQKASSKISASKRSIANEEDSTHLTRTTTTSKITAVVLPQPQACEERKPETWTEKNNNPQLHPQQQPQQQPPHHHHDQHLGPPSFLDTVDNGQRHPTAASEMDDELRDSTAAFVTAEILSEYPMDLSDAKIQQTVDRVLQAKRSAADLIGKSTSRLTPQLHKHSPNHHPTALSFEEAKVLLSIERLNERLTALQHTKKTPGGKGSR